MSIAKKRLSVSFFSDIYFGKVRRDWRVYKNIILKKYKFKNLLAFSPGTKYSEHDAVKAEEITIYK
jgi:hypothetical protein